MRHSAWQPYNKLNPSWCFPTLVRVGWREIGVCTDPSEKESLAIVKLRI